MKNLKLKFLCAMALSVLLLTSCQSEKTPSDEISESEPNISVSAPAFPALEKHDETWWWENYLNSQAYDFQAEYPSDSIEANQKKEFSLLFTYAYLNDMTLPSEIQGYDVKVSKENLNKIAPIVLNKPDVSHLDFIYMEDSEGYVHYYGNFENSLKDDDDIPNGNWAFTVTNVSYPTDYKADVTVETELFKRVFSYEQNEHNHYVLNSVTEEAKGEINEEKDSFSFETTLSFKEYSLDKLDKSALYYSKIAAPGDRLIIIDKSPDKFGFYRYYVYDAKELSKEPLISFDVKMASTELDQINTDEEARGDFLFVHNNESIRKYSLSTGELVKEIAVSDNYKKMRQMPHHNTPFQYIFDDDLNYMSYSCEDGLFLDDLGNNKSIKVCEIEEYIRVNSISTYPYAIKDNKLYYIDNFNIHSFENLKCFDIESEKKVLLDISLPKPPDHMGFNKVIGSKYIAKFLDLRITGDHIMEIYDSNTKESKLVNNIDHSYWGDVIYTKDKAFLEHETIEGMGSGCDELYEINLETGELSQVFKASSQSCSFTALDNLIIVTCPQKLIVLSLDK